MKKISSLTGGVVPMFAWKLPAEIAAYKVAKMPAGQWTNVIKGFSQKGVKGAEIEDSKIMAHLEKRAGEQITREELAEYASYALPSIKEVNLSGADTHYKAHSWARGPSFKNYNETLFYFPTVTEDFSDRISDLDEAISQINFQPDLLGEDPDIVLRLDSKREELLDRQKAQLQGVSTSAAHATINTHFSGNLKQMCPDARADFAHMRWSVMEQDGIKTLFIHEFQSDWAQRGRKEAGEIQTREMHRALQPFLAQMIETERQLIPRIFQKYKPAPKATPETIAQEKALDAAADALYERYVGPTAESPEWKGPKLGAPEWKGVYKKAPLVSETEYWTAFCLRRAMFLALEHQCTQLTWINGSAMINGGGSSNPGADEFYMKIVCSIAGKLAKPFKSELALKDYEMVTKGGTTKKMRLATMPITTEMRDKLNNRVTVYSHARVLANASFDPVRAEQLRRVLQADSDKMFGPEKAMRIKVVSQILSACDSKRPAGALIGKIAEVAFGADDPVRAMRHEAFHFACAYHFTNKEKQEIFRHFEPGSPLLTRTIRLLLANDEKEAALQCTQSPEEAAAHAFSMWKAGFMPVSKIEQIVSDHVRAPVLKVISKYFPQANQFITNIASWIRGSSTSPTDFVARIVRAHAQVKDTPEQDQAAMDHRHADIHPDEDADDPDHVAPTQVYS